MEVNKKQKINGTKPRSVDQNSFATSTKNVNEEKQIISKPGLKRRRRTAEEKREANRLKRLRKLESVTPEQLQERRERNRITKRNYKLNETLEQRFARLERDRRHRVRAKMRETPEQREARLAHDREYRAKVRNRKLQISGDGDESFSHGKVKNESPEVRQNRLEKQRIRKRQARENETPEQKNIRMERDRLRMQRKRAQKRLEKIQAEHGHFGQLEDTPDNFKRKAQLEIDYLHKKIKRELEKPPKSDSFRRCESIDSLENSSECHIYSSQSSSKSSDAADCTLKAGSEASYIKQESMREDERICLQGPLDPTEPQQKNETDLHYANECLVFVIKDEAE